jgi:fused signal recognition particle receptor
MSLPLFGKKGSRPLAVGLQKSRQGFLGRLKSFLGGGGLSPERMEELEELLLLSDVGVPGTRDLVGRLGERCRRERLGGEEEALGALREELVALLQGSGEGLRWASVPPTVVLVVGVNGSGKTTSVAKIASMFKQEGKKVVLSASDTFRAAAVEQLLKWSERIGVDCIHHQQGADPSAVAFDAAAAAKARKADLLIVDTAGRLHTASHLMQELSKIHRVLGREVPGAPHETLLVLDATTGQNAIAQARIFLQATQVTGVVLAKLDGTARGGGVVAIQKELGIPVKFVGTGETLEDLAPFSAEAFVEGWFRE